MTNNNDDIENESFDDSDIPMNLSDFQEFLYFLVTDEGDGSEKPIHPKLVELFETYKNRVNEVNDLATEMWNIICNLETKK